tara:strand:+ start:190 stop:588 length:399 start_codon:yes stop_codon:yes gene_type:complete
MIPGIFKNISQKLKCLDKLKIPLETIDIIKSFTFHKIHSHTYYKIISKTKAPLLDKFTRIKYISHRNQSDGHWGLGFLTLDNPEEYSQLQAVNCIYCGEFLYAGWRSYIKYNCATPPSQTVPHCKCAFSPEF